MNDPIISRSVMGNKNDIMLFKNETLKDFKDAQKKVTEKYKGLEFEIKEKLASYEQRITTYENKILELSNLINTDKTIRDKVDTLMEFKEKVDDKMLTEKIRLDNFRNDLNSNVDRIDQILKDSVIYPGVVGGISKYKTFHDLIDYILTQCSLNLTFREKSILDFKGYKTKLENTISSFNTQVNTILNSTSEYTKTCVKELEERMKSVYNVYDDRLQDTRLENANYAVGLERATEALKKELENLEIIKRELYDKVDKGITEIKNDNTRVVKLFSGYKKNFHVMQHKFTQLSDFIKDIRFRINIKEDVKRREYSQMSDLINFDKKKKPGFYAGVYDHSIIKKGLASQLKDYIEGKITADQLFKKRGEPSKSVEKPNDNNSFKKKSLSTNIKMGNTFGGDVKLNFVDLLKSTLSKRMSSTNQKINSNYKKDTIKEEDDDELINSSKELNSIYKTEKYQDPNDSITEYKNEEIVIEDKKPEKIKNSDKIEKDNINKTKIEDSKIQIVSKDKENTNNKNIENTNNKNIENEKNKNIENEKNKNIENVLKKRPSIKNVITDLFNVKNIIDNMKSNKNETPFTEKKEVENEKNDKSDKKEINNSKDNNANYNSLYNDLRNDPNKMKQNKKDYNRPATVISIKKNEQNPLKQNNIGIITNNEIYNNRQNNRINTPRENKKIGNMGSKPISVNIYNATMDSLGQFIQTSNFNQNKRKPNSTSQKKLFLKQNTAAARKNDTRTIEGIFNNLNNYVNKNDINMEENKFFSLKKKK